MSLSQPRGGAAWQTGREEAPGPSLSPSQSLKGTELPAERGGEGVTDDPPHQQGLSPAWLTVVLPLRASEAWSSVYRPKPCS